MSKLPLAANVSETVINVTVSSAAGGAGAAVSHTGDSASVLLNNTGNEDIEYQVDAGPWTLLRWKSNVTLDINMATQTVKTRKTLNTANGTVVVTVSRVSEGYTAGDEVVGMTATVCPVNSQTGTSYTLALTDAGKLIDMSNAAANTLNIPTNAVVAFPVGTRIEVCMKGAGVTTIAGAGVTLEKPATKSLSISAQFEKAILHKVATNTWRVNAS